MTLILLLLNYVSVKASSKVVSTLAIAKFIGMGIIIIGGIVRLIQGDDVGIYNFNHAFEQEDLAGISFTQIGLALYQGLWAYDGWVNLTSITEEVKDSKRNVPLAIIISVPLVMVFYVLVNIAYLSGKILESILKFCLCCLQKRLHVSRHHYFVFCLYIGKNFIIVQGALRTILYAVVPISVEHWGG